MSYAIERSGEDRRQSDGHCQNHEVNTTDIAGIKSAMTTLKWITGLMVPIGMALVGYFQVQNGGSLKEIDSNLKMVQTAINQSITADAITRMEVDRLKRDVELLQGSRK